jgi:flagellar motor protein MotB
MSDEHKDQHGEGGGEGHGGGGHAEGEHEGAPEWLISFADNVMLQMGFFVILLAMNMGPKGGGSGAEGAQAGGAPTTQTGDNLDLVLALREGFNNPVSMNSTNPAEAALVKRLKDRAKGGDGRTDGPTGKHERQQAPRPSDFDRVTASIPFDDRAAVLDEAARATIAEVAARQKDQRWILEIRGHASPFEGMHNPTKALDLSFERAKAVANALVDAGMKWEALRVVGMGDSDRIVARTFDRQEDRSNQRVEIVVTNYPIPEDPNAAPGE